ncbi:hypothetical protein [Paenibacillus sp. MMS20-IR301]|uniref:hypothetical protein n=1 Tax=Paenibacillus sp. MMS20-IR301 TaxID=2895946 RepID=UPI0028E8D065|nr:hypothetical protein [Paenibacillus sp. MMS20-IR301]WNS44295.1 hypothetical protein LOS79_03210 [Paenibacillus sp. MMS20-IR301]
MSTHSIWRLLLGLIVVMTLGGCSSALGSGNAGSGAGNANNQITLSVLVGELNLAGTAGRLLTEAYTDGNTMIDLLRKSGVAAFAADGYSITEVNRITLSSGLMWEIQVNGKKLTDWNSKVERGSAIALTVKAADAGAQLQPIIITVNGGSEQPELTHSHVLPYTEELTVRGLMKKSGMITLAEDNKTILTVMDYARLSNEEWKLKVNDKGLLGNGMDMKLRPQDKLEIALILK